MKMHSPTKTKKNFAMLAHCSISKEKEKENYVYPIL